MAHYDTNFYTWTQAQAEALRAKDWSLRETLSASRSPPPRGWPRFLDPPLIVGLAVLKGSL
jgi:hypothetical protein